MKNDDNRSRWTPGNQVALLENGEAFYPAVFEAIASAKEEVVLETFIVFEDKVGLELRDVLRQAALRGVRVDMLVDGFGSADLTEAYIASLAEAGVRLRSFDPSMPVMGMRTNVLRRMHRKIVVVDGERAFVGGINYSADHLGDFGPEAKQDYAVELRGPIVAEIRRFALKPVRPPAVLAAFDTPAPAGEAEAMLVTRDNVRHTNGIERHYLAAIRTARKRVLIANAYFFPGYRLLRALRRAARRGVEVQLILQGAPDVPVARTAAQMLYGYLQRSGVKIHEYCKRPLHGKVAVVDDTWATVGSSNLDPLSLSLNLEANVIIRDAGFNAVLAERLEHLICHSCKEVPMPERSRWDLWAQLRGFVVFHALRRFGAWATWLPRHQPRLHLPMRPARQPEAPRAQRSLAS